MAAPRPQHEPAAAAPPEPLVIGAAREECQLGESRAPSGRSGHRHSQGRRVASLSVEEFQQLLAEVVRVEVSGAAGAALGGAQERHTRGPPARREDRDWKAQWKDDAVAMSPGSAADSTPSATPHQRQVSEEDEHEQTRGRSLSKHIPSPMWGTVRALRGIDSDELGHHFRSGDHQERQSMLELLTTLGPMLQAGAGAKRWACRWASRWDWLVHEVREPVRTGSLADCVQSRNFEFFFSCIIVLNAIYMAAATNYQVQHPKEGPTAFMRTADLVFVGVYSVELVLRLIVHRWFFFWNGEMRWNLLDFCLVAYGIFDLIVDTSTRTAAAHQSPAWLRALRLFKMAKVLRMLRVIRTLKELHLIMACILGSFRSLFWSLIMMCVILYMFSLVFVQQAATYLSMGTASDKMEEDVMDYYGSVESSMFTMFKTIFGGDDWAQFYDVMAEVSILAQIIFVFFVAFSHIALLNILTGIFVENALKLAEPHYYDKANDHSRMVNEQAMALKDMLTHFDSDLDGAISRSDFAEMMKDSRAQKYMRYLGIEVPDVETFFNMLGGVDEKGRVKIDRFVESCMRLRGEAKSIQLNQLLYEVKCLDLSGVHSEVSSLRHDFGAVREFLEGLQSAAASDAEDPRGGNAWRPKPTAACSAASEPRRRAGSEGMERPTAPASPDAASPDSRRNGQVLLWGRSRATSHSCLPLLA